MYKTINDYIPQLLKLFPNIDLLDIIRSVNYGWRMLYFYNLRGCDTLIESQKYKFWMYCGELNIDSKKHFNYYKTMLRRKIRSLFIKKKIQWDGYYYTNLNEEEYNKFKKSLTSVGRKRKYFKFENKISFKILDEAKLFFSNYKYIIKYKYITDMGYSFKKDILKCEDVHLVLEKEKPDTFKDILINNTNYDTL